MKPTRWSYSSLSCYESCPAKWKYSYIDQLPGQPSPAMARGSRLHSDCENFLKGTLMTLPWELAKSSLRINDVKTRGGKAEEVWLLNKDWTTTEDDPWIKAIIDAHWIEGPVLYIRDWKTGREYPEHRDQLELYAVIGLCRFPETKRAEYGAIYLDTNHMSNEGSVLRGSMLDQKREAWNKRAVRIFEDETYAPRPGPGCKWCDYSHNKGGPCQAG